MGHARFLWVALFVMAAISEAHAAPPAGVVEGMARDALQRPLAGVHLRLEAPDARVVGNVSSGPDGAYRFTGVAPGVYSVVAEQEGFETATAVVSVDAGAGAGADLTLASKQALDLSVVAKRLEAARVDIQPRIGATTYIIPSQAIENQPGGGENNPLNQVVLQAPGVTQDSFGQIHVRNEHANVQYRINSVILPEGVSVFGQSLSPRIASSVDLITGALPAEYGLRTAGIIDIQTKSGAFKPGGSVGIYGGSHGWLEPSAEYGGSIGTFNYFVAGDYLQNGAGIEPPTRTYHPIHDATEQGHGFAYLEDILDATSKVSAIFGTYRGQFQIPDIPGQTSNFHANGISAFDSAQLDENQREINHYGVLSYLKSTQDIDFQISGFTRYSSLSFRSDVLGDLLFSGIAESAYRRSFASGLQIASDHTLRSGVIVTGERTTLETTSLVLPAVGGVQVPPDTPFPVVDNGAKTGWTYSLYLQDEWRLTPPSRSITAAASTWSMPSRTRTSSVPVSMRSGRRRRARPCMRATPTTSRRRPPRPSRRSPWSRHLRRRSSIQPYRRYRRWIQTPHRRPRSNRRGHHHSRPPTFTADRALNRAASGRVAGRPHPSSRAARRQHPAQRRQHGRPCALSALAGDSRGVAPPRPRPGGGGRFRVAANGSAEVELIQPTPDAALNRALLDTLKKWRFFPAMEGGKPQASTLEIRIPISVR